MCILCFCLLCSHISNISFLNSEMGPSHAQAPTIAWVVLYRNTCLSFPSTPHAHPPSSHRCTKRQQERGFCPWHRQDFKGKDSK